MKVFLIVVVAFVAIVAVIAATGVLDEAPPMPPARAVEIPAGANVFDELMGPHDLIGSAFAGLFGDGGGGGDYTDWWIPEEGWQGTMLKQKAKPGGITRISLDISDIKAPGFSYIYLTITGDPGEIPEGRRVYFRGRIASVKPSKDPLTQAHIIEVDNATVIRHGG